MHQEGSERDPKEVSTMTTYLMAIDCLMIEWMLQLPRSQRAVLAMSVFHVSLRRILECTGYAQLANEEEKIRKAVQKCVESLIGQTWWESN